MNATGAIVSILTGLPFGYALHRGRMTSPAVIRDQFRMADFRMMKMFLTATATGATILAAGNLMGIEALAPIHIKELRPLANFVGGTLLGAGMHLTGSCPGTVWAQLADVSNAAAPWVLAGGMVGASAYAGIDQFSKALFGHTHVSKLPAETLSELIGQNWALTALLLASGMGALTYALNKYLPSKPRPDVNENAWDPVPAGATIGLLQIPSFFLAHTALGASSAYVALAGGALSLAGSSNTYLLSHAGSAKSVGQLVQNVAMVAGAYIAAKHLAAGREEKKELPKTLTIKSRAIYVAGGAMLLFGSRLADGCTSGHGLSGVAQLALSSMFAVIGMFAGGFAVGYAVPNPVAPGQ